MLCLIDVTNYRDNDQFVSALISQDSKNRRVMFVQGIGKNCTRTFLREKFEIFGDIEETKVFFREDKYVLSVV